MKLWPKAIPPSDIKFKSLRATFGTVACEVAGGTDFAKVALGHASQKTTEKHYIAARAARLHEMASRVRYGVPPPTPEDAADDTVSETIREDELDAASDGATPPATYPALTDEAARKEEAGTPRNFPRRSGLFSGGVYGTRNRWDAVAQPADGARLSSSKPCGSAGYEC